MRERLGRYKINRILGNGGMGDVYLATDPQLDRDVAIKTIRFRAARTPQEKKEIDNSRERLFREARVAARLSHPNIVTVYDMGEDDGEAYIVMEFVEGRDLNEALETSAPSLTTDRLLQILPMWPGASITLTFEILSIAT